MPHVRQEQVGHVIDILPIGDKEKVLAKGAVKLASTAKHNLGLNRGSVMNGLNNPINQQRIKNRAPRTSTISIMWDIINDPMNRALLSSVAGPLLIKSTYDYVRNNWGKTYKPKPLSPEKIARESAKLEPQPQPETKDAESKDAESKEAESKEAESKEEPSKSKDMGQSIQTESQTLIHQTPFDRDVRIEALKKQLQELKLNQISHGVDEQQFTKKRKFRPELREFNPERLNFYVSKEHEDLETRELREFKYIPEGSGVATYESEAGLNPIHNDNKLHDEIRYRGVISLMRDYEPPGYKFVLRREG